MDFMLYPTVTFQNGASKGQGLNDLIWHKYDVSFNVWTGTPLILDARAGDFMSFIVQDDLRNLSYFRILTNGIEESIFPERVYV